MVRIAVFVILVMAAGGLVFALASAVQFWVFITTRRGALVQDAVGSMRDDLPKSIAEAAERGLAGDTPATRVHFEQAAELSRGPREPWLWLDASQDVAAGRSGFVWVAKQGRGPVPKVKVVDAYDPDTGGVLAIRLFGAVPIGTQRGGQVDRAEAMRYLAELPWCPDAMLTNPEIRWAESGDQVSATLQTRGGDATVTFSFDESGDIIGVEADSRPATQPDGSVLELPWRGTLGDYRMMGARRVPTDVEVGYVYDSGYAAYFRAQITRYEVRR